MEVLPDNHSYNWTNEELNNLIKAIKSKTPIHIIAKNHKRTVGAIKFKIIRYIASIIEEKEKKLILNDIMKESKNPIVKIAIINMILLIVIIKLMLIGFLFYSLRIVVVDGLLLAQ